jgi:hypothetical protein
MNRNPNPNLWPYFAGLLLVALGLSACDRPEPTTPAATRTELQSRVTNSFSHVVYLKPAETGADQPREVQLAPLIIQQLASTNASELWRDQPRTALGLPAVTAWTNSATIGGTTVPQFCYVWNYPATSSAAASARQGIRITLNSAGAPVIWEVLGDSSGADVIYVARSIEVLAQAEFGSPEPDRKFSVEQSLARAPRTVVANVIDDGPVLMGPIVYLETATRDVAALICRCMPAQFEQMLGQREYLLQLMAAPPGATNFPAAALESRLRLPKTF